MITWRNLIGPVAVVIGLTAIIVGMLWLSRPALYGRPLIPASGLSSR